MLDEKDMISEDDVPEDSIGHGEWRGIAPRRSDAAAQDLNDDAESDGAEASAAGEPSADSYPSDVAHDMSADLGLGYRDYGAGSKPAEEEAEE